MSDDGPAGPEPRPVSLAGAIRSAFSVYLEEIVIFLAVNLGLVLAVGFFLTVAAVVPLLLLLAPVLALPTAVLMRLAVVAAREGTPSRAIARAELGRLGRRKVLLAAAQLLITLLGAANVALAWSIGGLPGILSAVVAGYALIASTIYALALWPIVCDPRREAPLGEQLRLALAVVLLRPLQLVVLGLITVLSVAVAIQLIVPAIFLPSFVMLVVAAYVVDVADRLRPASDA